MKKDKVLFGILVLTMSVLLSSSAAYACRQDSSHSNWKLGDKIEEKVMFIKHNQEELGVTDEQVKMLKDLKHQAQKIEIKRKAEIDVLGIDFKAATHSYPVDEKVLYDLIVKKHEIKNAMAKDLSGIYAKVKNSLSAEQYQQMKQIWTSSKGKGCGHGCSKCSSGKGGDHACSKCSSGEGHKLA